jgi:hypothetical protein
MAEKYDGGGKERSPVSFYEMIVRKARKNKLILTTLS